MLQSCKSLSSWELRELFNFKLIAAIALGALCLVMDKFGDQFAAIAGLAKVSSTEVLAFGLWARLWVTGTNPNDSMGPQPNPITSAKPPASQHLTTNGYTSQGASLRLHCVFLERPRPHPA